MAATLRTATLATAFLVTPSCFVGCADNTPPPPRILVPASPDRDASSMRTSDAIRPNPAPPPLPIDRAPFHDAPLVQQAPPEQAEFVDMYRKVDSPRILVFVNRSVKGDILPVNTDQPSVTVTHTRSSDGPVDVQSSASVSGSAHAYGYGWYDSNGSYHASSSDKFSSKSAAKYTESSDVYLHPGDYDDAQARSLDYGAIENIMTDWIACQGQVVVVSPTMARQRLTDPQVKELQEGRPQALSEIAQQLNADVLIQVQARPTRQTVNGLEVRLVAEALNTHGGQSLARATVDIQPPLDKPQINDGTRFLARKLMADMAATWAAPPPPEMRSTNTDSTTQPAPSMTPSAVLPPPDHSTDHSAGHSAMPPLFGGSLTPMPKPTSTPTTTPGMQLP